MLNITYGFNICHIDSKSYCYACIYVCFVSNIYKLHIGYDRHFLASCQPGVWLIAIISSLPRQPLCFLFSTFQPKTTFPSSFSKDFKHSCGINFQITPWVFQNKKQLKFGTSYWKVFDIASSRYLTFTSICSVKSESESRKTHWRQHYHS